MPLKGLDVSNDQGSIDWSQVAAAGYVFAWCKATEGTTFIDPTFRNNWNGIRAAGMVRGAYHFARPDGGASPDAEADAFIQTVGQLQPGDLVALDLEAGGGDLSGWRDRWLVRVADQMGVNPLWYANNDYIINHRLGYNAQFGLWFAGSSPDNTPLPVVFWQGGTNSVPSIEGPVDMDQFFGDEHQLALYGFGGAPQEEDLTPDQDAKLSQIFTMVCTNGSPPTIKDVVERVFNMGGDRAGEAASLMQKGDAILAAVADVRTAVGALQTPTDQAVLDAVARFQASADHLQATMKSVGVALQS